MLYTSITYSFGPIIGPFVGGVIQEYLGWKANFYTLGFIAFLLLTIVTLFISESIPERHTFTFKTVATDYLNIIKARKFQASIIVCGLIYFGLMVYPTVGAFIVVHLLAKNAIVYGNSALIISCGYLDGSLLSRFLLKVMGQNKLIDIGFLTLACGLILTLIFTVAIIAQAIIYYLFLGAD